jgi:hypothetical protein
MPPARFLINDTGEILDTMPGDVTAHCERAHQLLRDAGERTGAAHGHYLIAAHIHLHAALQRTLQNIEAAPSPER